LAVFKNRRAARRYNDVAAHGPPPGNVPPDGPAVFKNRRMGRRYLKTAVWSGGFSFPAIRAAQCQAGLKTAGPFGYI